MQRKYQWRWAAGIGLLLIMPYVHVLTAQTRMERAVVAEGGGRSTSPTTTLEYTVGQTVVNRAASSTTNGSFGFWMAPALPASAPNLFVADALDMTIAPNPMALHANIAITVPNSDNMEISLYDLTGRRVATLYDGAVQPGRLTVPVDGARLAAGRYYVAISSHGTLIERPLTVVH